MKTLDLLKNIKVLYVEDEPITRNQVFRYLKKNVGKVVVVQNGQSGIEEFNKEKPDVIITDLNMPDMSGIEMMKKIRSHGSKCPCIITSALSDSRTILQTVDLKIEKYLIKPIDTHELMNTLKEIIIEEIEQDSKCVVIQDQILLTKEQKSKFELEIRNIYSKYLKKNIGKGATVIQVFIKGKQIEILCKQGLSTLEENFLKISHNFKIIEIMRKTIYEKTKYEIEQQVAACIDRKVIVKEIEVYTEEKYERMLIEIID